MPANTQKFPWIFAAACVSAVLHFLFCVLCKTWLNGVHSLSTVTPYFEKSGPPGEPELGVVIFADQLAHPVAEKINDSCSRHHTMAFCCTGIHHVCISRSGLWLANACGVSTATHQLGSGSRTDVDKRIAQL
ncbi:MAG: hypothetical protein HHJ12_01175 [Glaciimonas sp.]|nr:hypothetical protein [Glaciimonas sp.]